MKQHWRIGIGALLFLCAGARGEVYSGLIATRDGSAVFVNVKAGFASSDWYEVRLEGGRPVAHQHAGDITDISEDGQVIATTWKAQKFCSSSGSTCWLADECRTGFMIEGPGFEVYRQGRRYTRQVLLSRDGRRAWIFQSDDACAGFTSMAPALKGLYELPGLRPMVAPPPGVIREPLPGRHLITNRDQVLTWDQDRRLQLLEAGGSRPVGHSEGVSQAVIDAAGRNIVYSPAAESRLGWIELGWIGLVPQTEETLPPATQFGRQLALSDDGSLLAFLSPERRLHLYRRNTRTVQRVEGLAEQLREFALSGDGRFVFAVTQGDRVLRLALASGEVVTWLEPPPQITTISAYYGPAAHNCPLPCYGYPYSELTLSPGSVVVFSGPYLDQPGWSVRIRGVELPLKPLAREAVWFQVPSSLRPDKDPSRLPDADPDLVVLHPQHPLTFAVGAHVVPRAITCFGALHERFDRVVSQKDPARVGEIIHVFLTGVRGVEPVPDGVPNPADRLIRVDSPPELVAKDVLEVLFFGLAPGFIGLQQLDMRVLSQPTSSSGQTAQYLFRSESFVSGCALPPIVR